MFTRLLQQAYPIREDASFESKSVATMLSTLNPTTLDGDMFVRQHTIHEVLTRPWLAPGIERGLQEAFGNVQRWMRAFAYLARVWRFRRTALQVSTDLYMTPLDMRDGRTALIYQIGGLFAFSLVELRHLWIRSLTHASYLFGYPQPFRNPYTNVPFSKAHLYSFYWQMRAQHIHVPPLLETYFRCHFDVFLLKKMHDNLLLTHVVERYIRDASTDDLLVECDEMVMELGFANVLSRHPMFPKKTYVHHLKPYIRLFLLSKHGYDYGLSSRLRGDLVRQLGEFVKACPRFAQRHGVPPDHGYEFISAPASFPFQRERTERFLATHLYDSVTFDQYVTSGLTQMQWTMVYTMLATDVSGQQQQEQQEQSEESEESEEDASSSGQDASSEEETKEEMEEEEEEVDDDDPLLYDYLD